MLLALLRLDQLVLKRVLKLALVLNLDIGKQGQLYLDLPATGRSLDWGLKNLSLGQLPLLVNLFGIWNRRTLDKKVKN